MGRGELCHDQCVGLLLAGHTRSIGAARSDARGAFVQAPHLSLGFGDLYGSMGLSVKYKK